MLTSAMRGEMLTPNHNECNATLTSRTSGGRAPTSWGNSTLIRWVCATGILNLSPCSGVGKLKKDTLLWSYCSFLKSIALHCIALYCIVLYCIVLYCIVLYCIVLYCIVLYCIVLYCIVLYCIGDKDHVFALLI